MQLKPFSTVAMILLLLGLQMPPIVDSAQPEEYQLKAVFVLNFAKLTEWPADLHADTRTFTIAVLGKLPSTTFISLLKGQTVHGANVVVKHVDNVRQAKDAQLLYISESERSHLPGILKEAGQYCLLAVSDITGFCEAGGMIGLIPVQNRLSFEINVASIRKARLSVNSQLLKLAKVLYGM
jgi:hypothetical protein